MPCDWIGTPVSVPILAAVLLSRGGAGRARWTRAGRLPQHLLLLLVGYNAVLSLWGWPQPHLAPAGTRNRRFRVVVPAHNEGAVLAPLLEDLAVQDYDGSNVTVEVLADRCTDTTVSVARAHAGVTVVERHTGPDGKGEALAWYLRQRPLEADEALVVVDADNRVPDNLLARFADELDCGHHAVQANLDVANPDGSAVAVASALTYWAGNRMVQLARANLGWSADLGGTGMCLTPEALRRAGGFAGGATEDQELAARLAEEGLRVVWMHDVRVRDEKPEQVGVAVQQRARWMAGKRQAARVHVPQLVRSGLARRSPAELDVALRLVQPSRSFVALVTLGLAGVAARRPGPWLLGWRVWAGATGLQVLLPPVFLARDGVPVRYLLRYPFVTLVAALWVPVRVLSSRSRGRWYHTPHRGAGEGPRRAAGSDRGSQDPS